MEARSVLQHLVLIPQSGLCNRLRAIASARRLCQRFAARCSIVWDWGDFWDLFTKVPDVEIIQNLPQPDKVARHQPRHVDPTRTVDITVRTLQLHSGQIFWGSHESQIQLHQLVEYVPRLNSRLQGIVDDFAKRNLQNTVGFHLRRTDQAQSILHSPDVLFFRKANEIISEGKKIFLATDNLKTIKKFRRKFGDMIIVYPKRTELEKRWPRPQFDQMAVEDDLIDLFLLVKSEYIIGSHFSSFSCMARALNGSPKSAILKTESSENLNQHKNFVGIILNRLHRKR